jgi:hypothetical protein
MKAEYLASGGPDCPILRLYDFDVTEARQLMEICISLADGSAQWIDLPAEAINGCRLTLGAGPHDIGVRRIDKQGQFTCVLTRQNWQDVADRTETLCCETHGECYQWLDETSKISLLLSESGHW